MKLGKVREMSCGLACLELWRQVYGRAIPSKKSIWTRNNNKAESCVAASSHKNASLPF